MKKTKFYKSEAHLPNMIDQARRSSIDDLYIGKRVTELPEEAFMVKIGPRNWVNEVTDLDLEAAKESLEQLRMPEKPKLSKKAWTRLSNKKRSRLPSAPEDLTDSSSRGDSGKAKKDSHEEKPTANGQLPGYQGTIPVIKEDMSSDQVETEGTGGCPSHRVPLR